MAIKTAVSQQVTITLSLIEAASRSTPIRVQLTKALNRDKSYELRNIRTREVVPAQLIDSATLIFMSQANLPPGDHSYAVHTTNKARRSRVSVDKTPNGLLFKVNNKPVFFYHASEAMPPPDSPAYYKRSGFIHPLYSPSGKIMTDDFPVGHAHQHGVFMAWTSTLFRGTPVDFWNQHSKKGTVEHIEVVDFAQGPVVARVTAALRHISLQFGEVLREKWILTVYPLDNYFLFDIESEQHNITADTLFLNKYHYGGLAFRGSPKWNKEDRRNFNSSWHLLTSEGATDSAANATHARWVDIWGEIDNGIAGASVFNHPSNFRYPQALRVHPVMPYWAYSPMVDGAFAIPPGGFYRSKFRYYVHDGQVSKEMIESLYHEWAMPPKVKADYR